MASIWSGAWDDVKQAFNPSSDGLTLEERVQKIKERRKERYFGTEADKYIRNQGVSNVDMDARNSLVDELAKPGTRIRSQIDRDVFKQMKFQYEEEHLNKLFNVDSEGNPRAMGAIWNVNGLRHTTVSERDEMMTRGIRELEKSAGNITLAPSLQTGYVASKQALDNASFGNRLKYFGKTLFDATPGVNLLSASTRDMLGGQAGIITKQARLQMLSQGSAGKVVGGVGTVLPGVLGIYMATQAQDPFNEFLATTLSTTAIQANWRLGKATASLAKGGHLSRVAMGASLALPATLATYGAIKSFTDLTSSESKIVEIAKKHSRQESFHFTKDTKMTATMRQRALQKLSASAMNNRGQLLGQEANILRGSPGFS